MTEDEELALEVRLKVQLLAANDEFSASDLKYLFRRYNDSSPADRDSIDAAFVWMTGYTLATICAMAVTPSGKDYERTLAKWRKGQS